jgi:hypothetical protein
VLRAGEDSKEKATQIAAAANTTGGRAGASTVAAAAQAEKENEY